MDVKAAARQLSVSVRQVEGHCEKHGQHFAMAAIVDGKEKSCGCPQCFHEAEQARYSEERRARQNDIHQQTCAVASAFTGIPKRFIDAEFSTYRTDNEGQKACLECAMRYVENFKEVLDLGSSMIMVGNTGTGKTRLAFSLANALLRAKYSVVYTRAYDLLDAVRSTWSRDAGASERNIVRSYYDADLLILDEVGVQNGTANEKVILFQIMDRRYLDMKPTVVISNGTLDELKVFIGDRVFDRLRDNGGKLLSFPWDSERGNKANAVRKPVQLMLVDTKK